MSRRHYEIPPFTTLAVFEAAARHMSFKNAAQELSVTPGAVSHQIKALESELGTQLFLRQHRGVTLTKDGEALFETLASSFAQISQQVARIRQPSEDQAVTVGSTTAVAALWLSPTVIDFWRDHPETNVHQVTQDRPFTQGQNLDLFINYGPPESPALSQTPIYRDELVPVAAPQLAATLNGISLEALAQQRLIHLESALPAWTRWSEWFAGLGYDGKINQGSRVTSYSVALQFAQQGAGIALGWRRLVASLVDRGKLAVVSPHSLPAPHRFHLCGKPDANLSQGARALKSWLLDSASGNSG
ncbi:LysR family transcriptional regulator [Epibacterium sp. SM1969]|uniref:LysR family transcriptional regulator n=1 Tax=Tritonibacter aquimaris TaxID=2663379 RepID=A0A844ANE1_9RHOB|nr:LysR substrate-binding domain-containing protein [Tritonibacter aquimaris]MQY43859.1 LysR family transcriptional regulator [Tritonibacter aquimaris]